MKHLSLSQPHAKAVLHIRRFFDIWSLPSVLRESEIIFTKAASDKAWRPANPYNVIHFCGQVKKLSAAAFIISRYFNEDLVNKTVVKLVDGHPAISHYEQYAAKEKSASAFHYFPRHLASDEYRYPPRALRVYCHYRSKQYWKKFYRQLAQCTLSSTSIKDYEPADKLFKIYRHIVKMIEACHLIHVRLGNMPVVLNEEMPAG